MAQNDRERAMELGAPAMEIPFSLEEYRKRLQRIRQLMARAGIDLLYLSAPESLYYVSGYRNEWYQAQSPKSWMPWSGIAVHVDHDRFILFDSASETLLIRAHTVAGDVRAYQRGRQGAVLDWVVDELRAEGWLGGTVGLELWSYRPNRMVSEQFQAALERAECRVVDGTDVLREARAVKSPQELAYMETAARIADIGLAAARDTLRPGVTELEVYGELIAAMAKAGGENAGITLPVLSGSKSAGGHSLASRKQIAPGEVVLVDVCGVFNRYHVNVARNFAIGEPHPDVARRFEQVAGVFEVIAETLRPNLPVGELNEAVQGYYEESGIWEHRGYIGGYELGIAFPPDWVGEFNYGPHLDAGQQVFAPGTVVNHEAQFYLPRAVGYCMLIDSFMFTETDARILGQTPHELCVIA
jgi:Xaa-Pro aminopeptidase